MPESSSRRLAVTRREDADPRGEREAAIRLLALGMIRS